MDTQIVTKFNDINSMIKVFSHDKILKSVRYFEDDFLHRKSKPALITYLNGIKDSESYYFNDKLFRSGDEPSLIYYFPNGEISYIGYVICDIYHREPEKGPACIDYYPNGKKRFEYYMINDFYHREGNPAKIIYNEDGTIKSETFYILGDKISKR